jgi:hypothetical protein
MSFHPDASYIQSSAIGSNAYFQLPYYQEVPAAGLTMRINEGSFYTKNFTAMDLDGDYLVWSVTGLPGATMVGQCGFTPGLPLGHPKLTSS